MKKNIGLCIFLFIHLYYIIRLSSTEFSVFKFCFLLLFLIIAYVWRLRHNPHNHSASASHIPSSVISASIGGACCFVLSQQTGPILACGIVGFFASFLTHLFKDKKYHELPYSTYCGCFVGMSAHSILPDAFTVSILAGLSGLLFATTKRSLEGVGGRLGSISFASVVCYLLIRNYL